MVDFKKNNFFLIFTMIVFFILIFSLTLFKVFNTKHQTHIKKTTNTPKIIVNKQNFQNGDSIYKVLGKQNLDVICIYKIINLLSLKVSINNVKSNEAYEIETTTSGVFHAFSYYPNGIQKYRVYFSTFTNNYEIEVIQQELKKEILFIRGTIKSSLYNAVLSTQKGTPAMAVELTEIFAWQIDFLTDTRPGDMFEILCEYFYTSTGYSKIGRIYAAKYISKDSYTAFFYECGKESGYYDENGKAMKRAFLKSPLNYKRISSYFSTSRMHPIFKYRRPHLGIDYAAPIGTPVVSIGDGIVIFKGIVRGFGNQIKIKHRSGYESWYAHLSRFGNLKGSKIKQGQVIGYVGMTGFATGPHLDFRFLQNGKFYNYLEIKLPSSFSIRKKYLQNFYKKRDEYLGMMKINEN